MHPSLAVVPALAQTPIPPSHIPPNPLNLLIPASSVHISTPPSPKQRQQSNPTHLSSPHPQHPPNPIKQTPSTSSAVTPSPPTTQEHPIALPHPPKQTNTPASAHTRTQPPPALVRSQHNHLHHPSATQPPALNTSPQSVPQGKPCVAVLSQISLFSPGRIYSYDSNPEKAIVVARGTEGIARLLGKQKTGMPFP